jgi:beta-lactamase class A
MTEQFGDPSLLRRLSAEIAAFSGTAGLYAKNLTTGEEVGHDADAVMPTASTIKVCVLAELYRQADAGELDLGERIPLADTDWFGGSGVLKEFMPGLAPTLCDLARMMTVVSDNVATGMLVRRLGKDQINATMRCWGLTSTQLLMNMQLSGDIRDYAMSTPRELGRLMELVATDAIVSPMACAAMRDHLSRQQYLDQIARYLPFNPYATDLGATQAVEVMNKTGFYPRVRVDAAIVRVPGVAYVIATMTDQSDDPSFALEHEGNVLNGSLARLIFEAWTGGSPTTLRHRAKPAYLSLAERRALPLQHPRPSTTDAGSAAPQRH